MNKQDLHNRAKAFHIAVIKLCNEFPKTTVGFEITKQLIRSAGSVGSNARATSGVKSTNDFINKVAIVIEEADESLYWLEIVKEIQMADNIETDRLLKEANELTAIFVAISKPTKSNAANQKS